MAAVYQKCPNPGCGLGRQKGAELFIYQCGHCGQTLGHKGAGSSCIQEKGCTAEGRNGWHGNLKHVATVPRE